MCLLKQTLSQEEKRKELFLTSGRLHYDLFDSIEVRMENHMKAIVAKSGSEAQDAGAFVRTRQKTLTGLTPENIQAMHIKQVLVL